MSETPPIEPGPTAPPPDNGLPWEAQNAGLGSIFPTALGFISRPTEAFGAMSLSVDLVRPIAYFVTWALIGACISQLWSLVLYDAMLGVVRSLAGSQFERLAPLMHRPGPVQLLLGLVVTPLVALVFVFVWGAVVHLMLTLLGGANRGFTATLRVMCYAETTQIAALLPGIGGFIALVWGLILEVMGLSLAHKTEGWKAALAVVLPLFLCCVCVIAGAVLFGAAVGQALQQFK